MATLYELTGEYLQLLDMAQDPDTDPETLKDTLDAIGGELEDKADSYAKVISMLQADVDAIEKESARLARLKNSREANIARMKDSLQDAMEAIGKTKFKTQMHSYCIQKNPPKVVLDAEVPAAYLVPQPPKVDTAGIRDALKAGKELKFAHLVQGSSLRIR